MIEHVRCIGILAATAVLGVMPHASEPPRLEVAGDRHGVIWSAPIVRGELFAVEYVHSAERSVWVHQYRAGAKAGVEQLTSTFQAFGAGMPVTPPHVAAEMSPRGFTVAAPRTFSAIPFMNWRRSALTLQYRGRFIPVGRWLDEYEPFTVRIR